MLAAGVPADEAVRREQRGDAREVRVELARGLAPEPETRDGVSAVDDGHGQGRLRRSLRRSADERADDHLALLDERDRAPGSAARRVHRTQRGAQDLVGLLAAVDDRLYVVG